MHTSRTCLPHEGVTSRSWRDRVHCGLVVVVCWLLLMPGCRDAGLEFTDVKRIDEKITPDELQRFFRVVESLKEPKLPRIPPVFVNPPTWDERRTLPVNELVNEEQITLSEHWSVDWLARQIPQSRTLDSALRQEKMTREQFVGLALALGAALTRSTVRDDQDLEKTVVTGTAIISELRRDSQPFNSLTRDAQYLTLQQAIWVTRADRATRLLKVPPENEALALQHKDRLVEMFPEEFSTNPFDKIADLLAEQGMPFEELLDGNSDAQIEWHPSQANVGLDTPDPDLQEIARGTTTATN